MSESDADFDLNELSDEGSIADEAPEGASDGAERTIYPFFNIQSSADGIQAQAGWIDNEGELHALPVNLNSLSIARAQQAADIALGWYADAVAAAQNANEGDEEGER